MAEGMALEPITSKFQNEVGLGQGWVSPAYDPISTPIVVQNTDKGFLVHEVVTSLNPATWVNGKEGTGDIKSDAITYYTNEDFREKFGDNFVTLQQYQKDLRGIEGIHQTSGANSPVADDATDMANRLQELGKDMQIYMDANAAKLNDELAMKLGGK